MSRTLYELADVESPFVWRAKFALAHKQLDYESVRLGFTDIPKTCEGRHKTVPILVDTNGSETCDSMNIAAYLDDTYPDAPPLLGEGLARAREIDGMINAGAFPNFFPLYILDVWACLSGKEADYFRTTRETRFGATLEAISANRAERLPDARASLDPLRAEIAKASWLSGNAPGYADFIVLAFFAWIKAAASTPPLAADDPIADYVARGFALYDGLGESLGGGPLTEANT